MFVFFTVKMAVFYPSLTLIYWQFLPFISPEKITLSPLFQPLKLIVYVRFFHLENGSPPPLSHPHNPAVSSSYLFTCCEECDAPITEKFKGPSMPPWLSARGLRSMPFNGTIEPTLCAWWVHALLALLYI